MHVKIVQSGRFPNVHSLVLLAHDETIRIFIDKWDRDGVDSLMRAQEYAYNRGWDVDDIQSTTHDRIMEARNER